MSEIKVGDKVIRKSAKGKSGIVEAIRGNHAYVRWSSTLRLLSGQYDSHTTIDITDLMPLTDANREAANIKRLKRSIDDLRLSASHVYCNIHHVNVSHGKTNNCCYCGRVLVTDEVYLSERAIQQLVDAERTLAEYELGI